MRPLAVMLLLASAACGGTDSSTPLAATAQTKARAVLQLGRPICGECCVERVKNAFSNTSGVGQITMHPGDVDFLVEYDPLKITPDDMAAKLVAGGESGARVSPSNVRAQPEKHWVVARRH